MTVPLPDGSGKDIQMISTNSASPNVSGKYLDSGEMGDVFVVEIGQKKYAVKIPKTKKYGDFEAEKYYYQKLYLTRSVNYKILKNVPLHMEGKSFSSPVIIMPLYRYDLQFYIEENPFIDIAPMLPSINRSFHDIKSMIQKKAPGFFFDFWERNLVVDDEENILGLDLQFLQKNQTKRVKYKEMAEKALGMERKGIRTAIEADLKNLNTTWDEVWDEFRMEYVWLLAFKYRITQFRHLILTEEGFKIEAGFDNFPVPDDELPEEINDPVDWKTITASEVVAQWAQASTDADHRRAIAFILRAAENQKFNLLAEVFASDTLALERKQEIYRSTQVFPDAWKEVWQYVRGESKEDIRLDTWISIFRRIFNATAEKKLIVDSQVVVSLINSTIDSNVYELNVGMLIAGVSKRQPNEYVLSQWTSVLFDKQKGLHIDLLNWILEKTNDKTLLAGLARVVNYGMGTVEVKPSVRNRIIERLNDLSNENLAEYILRREMDPKHSAEILFKMKQSDVTAKRFDYYEVLGLVRKENPDLLIKIEGIILEQQGVDPGSCRCLPCS